MKSTTAFFLVAALLWSVGLGGCKEKPKTNAEQEKSIKELQKSGVELQATTEELLKRRGKLQRNRRDLSAARKALEAKKKALDKNDVAGRAKLAQEEAALKDREAKLRSQEDKMNGRLLSALKRQETFYLRATTALSSRGGGGDGTAGVRSREVGIAGRENRVAARERAVAAREKALNDQYRKILDYKAQKCATAAPVFTTITSPSVPANVGSRSYSKGDAKTAFAKAMSIMAGKGIRAGDLSGLSKLIGNIRRFIRTSEYARAKFAADSLKATLKSVKINRAFVGAKMGRLASTMRRKKLTEAKRTKVSKLFVQVTNAYNDGRFAAANRIINKIYGVIY